jgi:type IV pilus assembly protein PilY1
MKKYTISGTGIKDVNDNDAVDPDTGFFANSAKNYWSRDTKPDGADVYKGGSANVMPTPGLRQLYTNNSIGDLTTPTNQLSVGNLLSFDPLDFGLTGTTGEPSMTNLIDWARGVDVKDVDNDPDTLTRYSMGDTLHSQPAAVVYGETNDKPDIVLYAATNDGYLHAIDASTGEEIWSFVPKELLPNLTDLYYNQNVDYKNYGIDGDIVPIVADFDQDGEIDQGTDFVYLVFGMRRGGDNYYLLDVTDRSKPRLKWIKTFPQMGQSWSSPIVAKVNIDGVNNAHDAVLVLGGGYDTSHDAPAHPASPDLEGSGIYMLDLETGTQIWRAGRDSNADLQLDTMTRAIPSRVRVIDINGDTYADRMYAADLGGQIWRFDILNGKTVDKLVNGGVIAQLGAEGQKSPTPETTRRFYTTPDVAMFSDKKQNRRYLAINIGTGYRAHPLDNSASDRFYSLRDPDVFNQLTRTQYSNYSVIKDDDLIDVAGKIDTVIPADGDGWMFTLPPTQKVLSDASTFDDKVYFVTFEPTLNSDDPCQAGLSINRLYRVNIVNGDPVIEYGSPIQVLPEEADSVRVTNLEQGGIAPKPTFFFPSPTDPDCTGVACAPPPVGCVGVECFDPDFENNPVRTLWTQDGIY